MKKKDVWMIKLEDKENYYKGRTAIGPCFGGTKETGQKFETKMDAAIEMTTHSFAFTDAEVVEVKEGE